MKVCYRLVGISVKPISKKMFLNSERTLFTVRIRISLTNKIQRSSWIIQEGYRQGCKAPLGVWAPSAAKL